MFCRKHETIETLNLNILKVRQLLIYDDLDILDKYKV